MPRLTVRQSCPANAEFYRCAIGPFTGCCSINPCDTGICGDSSSGSSSGSGSGSGSSTLAGQSSSTALNVPALSTSTPLTSAGSSTASMNMPTSASTTVAASHRTSTHSSSKNPSSTHSSSTSSTSTSSPISVSPDSSNSSHHSKAATIGGVVGGLALAALLALLLYYCCRRKKKGGLKLNFNRNKNVEQNGEGKDQARDFIAAGAAVAAVAAASESHHAANRDVGGHDQGKDDKPRNSKFGMLFRHSGTTTATTQSSATFVDSGSNQDKVGSSTASPTLPYSNDEKLSLAGSAPIPRLDGTSVVPGHELPASTPGRLGFTPEMPGQGLPQTGRAELSPKPERLLINCPLTSARAPIPVSSTDSDYIERSPFMRSNLNMSHPAQENQRAFRKNGRKHVLSWMDYENQDGSDVTRNPSVENIVSDGLGIQDVTMVV